MKFPVTSSNPSCNVTNPFTTPSVVVVGKALCIPVSVDSPSACERPPYAIVPNPSACEKGPIACVLSPSACE